MPKKLEWSELKTTGTLPLPKIGHSLTKLDRMYMLIGGLEVERECVGPTATVFMLKMGEKAGTWTQVAATGDAFPPRCNHAACEIGRSQLLVFGGYGAKNARLSDAHVLKSSGTAFAWSALPPPAAGEEAPEPRANHTLVFMRERSAVLLFGGYGGSGYTRKAFNDLWSFDVAALRWQRLEPSGAAPEPRGGHIAGQLPNSEKMFVHGGWSSVSQFNRMQVYDLARNHWSEVNASFDAPRWNHTCVVVPALPHAKIFIFGGSTGFFEEGAPRNFGAFTNTIMYFDVEENMDAVRVQRAALEGRAAPRARENTAMVYDQVEHRILVFGGWSNSFSNDLHSLAIDSITGPDFAVYAIAPTLGPVTGSTRCRVVGEGFKPSTPMFARFSSGKLAADVPAAFVSERELSCESPAVEGWGPRACEVRLWAARDDPTITAAAFSYFLNTKAQKSLAFGPGLLAGNSPAAPACFYIQARSVNEENRTSGGDVFRVQVFAADAQFGGEEEKAAALAPHRVRDLDNGQYEVSYDWRGEGRVAVEVAYVNEQGQAEALPGSPFAAGFSSRAPAEANALRGSLMREHLQGRLRDIEAFIAALKGTIAATRGHGLSRHELLAIKEAIQRVKDGKDAMLLDLEGLGQFLALLGDKDRAREAEQTRALVKGLRALHAAGEEADVKIRGEVKVQSDTCLRELDAFEDELNQFYRDMKLRNVYSYATGAAAAAATLDGLEREIAGFEARLRDYDYFSRTFDFPQKPANCHKMLELIAAETQNVRKLWTHIQKTLQLFAEYTGRRWGAVDAAAMQDEVKALSKGLGQLKGVDRKSNVYQAIAAEMKNWALFLPIVEELRKDFMAVPDDRHWRRFKHVIGQEFALTPELPVAFVWGLGVYAPRFKEQIEELIEQAAQERKIERDLEKIKAKWDRVDFEATPLPARDGALSSLRVLDEDLEALDEHQLLIQSVASNKYVAYYAEEVGRWQRHLSAMNETIRSLLDVQKTWSFLLNLFLFSEEVKKDLREESENFVLIDRRVKEMLVYGARVRNVLAFCTGEVQGRAVPKILDEVLADLARCQKGLNDFISKKRKIFPRFYFLTMVELLDILANGNNPFMLFQEKNYMGKVVQAADRLELADGGGALARIVALTAAVGVERVVFVDGGAALEGKVENYLQDILDAVRKALMRACEEAVRRLGAPDRVRAVDGSYAQISLLANSVEWVHCVEERLLALQRGEKGAMRDYLQTCRDRLTELIRAVQGELSRPLRQKVMCLITIDTHNRDVVERLVLEGVTRAEEFHWQSQLKFYWVQEKRDVQARIADASFWYDYEYLGNGPRLVITPLTDRIYVTATQALHLRMGCAPAGPAGTGKTETTKDLSAALGKACYVFNCSPEMNYETMGNIFKGLAASGCWGCFDEFNRLVPEVLSVCSVQFKAVTDAIKMGKATVHVEDDAVRLDPTCGAFITMNPGYLGRSELPEGLKALFRPITVVVPDLELICENILMAEGFIHAKELACKFVTLYRLCRSLLSPQDHYDWGLRAIKSVLVVAGAFKRAEPDISEMLLLFRALRDFNYPKIAEVDLGIFDGLLEDLFPRTSIPRKVDPEFERLVLRAVEEERLTPHASFLLKIVQLNELLEIRHSVFLMGPPGCGKTTTWKMLARANDKAGRRTTCQDLDPKVVSTRDLYGYTNLNTKEWKNGLLSHYIQYFSEETTDGNPKWIILDGDLDANWIESMNSVMDDNKLLTLANNGRIVLKSYMRLLFEIRDLKHATPATVSRAGILYISDDSGYQRACYIASWLRGAGERLRVATEPLQRMFDKYFDKAVGFLLKHCKFVVPVSLFSMTVSLCRMLESTLRRELPNVVVAVNEKPSDQLDPLKVEYLFNFCAVWALGAALTEKDKRDYRKDFSAFWRGEYKGVKFPAKGSVFDYFVSFEEGKVGFEEWKSRLESIEYDPATPMQNVTVPIPETVSLQRLARSLITVGGPVLFIGSSGSGKTQLIKGLLREIRAALPDEYYFTTINFNYFTDSAYLQAMLENELVKQGNRFGPKKGGKARLIYFIDDLNMPALDTYNTQTAIALLRQHVDYSHWFDVSKNVPALREIVNTQVVAAMNPTSGSFYVNPRYQRHFWTVAVNNPEQQSQILIYETFLRGHFRRFKGAVQEMAVPLIKAAISLHDRVQGSFRKTAVNFHYEFTIRHLSAIVQGILMGQPAQFADQEKVVKLWVHESERVYADRLVSPEHIALYKTLAADVLKKNFGKFPLQKYFAGQSPESLLFVNFPRGFRGEKYYDDVPFAEAERHIQEALRDYNENLVEMRLVLFDDAVRHVCRITRILSSSSGHALLVGVGGSGKQSLTKLAAYICELTPFSITVSSQYSMGNLREDLVDLYRKTGLKDEGYLFLITDAHITSEQFLVYINDLLSSGEVNDLFNEDDRTGIIAGLRNKVKAEGKGDTPDDCWAYFIDKVRLNLHVTLCFSPVGDTFRTRARRFPSLTNCTVIDWFQPWPAAALTNVAAQFLAGVELGEGAVRRAVIDFMPFSFEAVNSYARKCFLSERRHVYSTPKSFLEPLALFKAMFEKKRQSLEAEREIYELGLEKLEETEAKVAELQESLQVIQVDVDRKKAEADTVAEVVGREKAKVEDKSRRAKEEEAACVAIKLQVETQKASCEEDVSALAPLVEGAKQQLSGLNVKEFQMLKSLASPPADIDKVFFCIMFMFAGVPGYDNDIELDKNRLPKNLDWKNGCLKLMKEPQKLIEKLRNFPREINEERVPAQNFAKIKPYFQAETFKTPAKMMAKSESAGNILLFITCMVQYYDAMTQMIPKRAALAEANELLAGANATLERVMAEVAELEAALAVLVRNFEVANAEKNAAMAEAQRCATKLELAQRLVSALSSEKGRWRDSIEALARQLQLVVGDVLLAAGFISYAGPFSKQFRELIVNEEFLPFVTRRAIPRSEDASPVRLLVDEATKAEWNNQGLPSDPVSTENGAILANSERYPLMIDPQLQGVGWIKNRERANELRVLRVGAKNYTFELERAIEAGVPVLFENMDEAIDPLIFPVISRKTYRRYGKQMMKFGGKDLVVSPRFRLYMHTKLSNPHYPPEIQAEAALINFTVTEDGLSDQLLALVVMKERPDLSASKLHLIQEQNAFKIKIKELERGLLQKLKTLEGEFLEDRDLINNLENSQVLSREIREKVEVSKVTEKQINETSELYRPAAQRGALVFFIMNELYKMSSFYIYSLEAFLDVIVRAIDSVGGAEALAVAAAPPAEAGEGAEAAAPPPEKDAPRPPADVHERVQGLTRAITYFLFTNVRRGLFERHKLIFSTFLCMRVLERSGALRPEEARHLVQGRALTAVPAMPEAVRGYLSEQMWHDCKALDYVPDLNDLCENLDLENLHWRKWFGEEKAEEVDLPKRYKDLADFRKLLVIKALRPDRVSSALKMFVARNLGAEYVEEPPFNIEAVYLESSATTPLFFVLFPGVDPTKDVERLGASKGKSLADGTIINISMGQGQERRAEAALRDCAERGNWIFLQNVHLMQSWLKTFERELEEVSAGPHRDFRVFISSEPPPLAEMKIIPEAVLQRCVKVSNEAPQDMKANMLRALSHFRQADFDVSAKPAEMKSVLFALCYFHSVVLGRRKFGSQGWSRVYNFNDGDLTICADVLRNYLEKYADVPYEDLRYMYGEIMYGGHITDDWDRRTNNTYLKVFIRPELLRNMNIVPAGHPIYRVPDPAKTRYEDYVRYLDKLPSESPLLFGMHSNTEINFLTQQCETIFRTIIEIQGGRAAAGAKEEDALRDVVRKFQEMLPEAFNMLRLREKLAETPNEVPNPYKVVCMQECERMNALLQDISTSLEELSLGLEGSLNMTENMETLAQSLGLNRVPGLWAAYYPSKKPLLSWFQDLRQRCAQLQEWSREMELPKSLCLSYLFNPLSFLTAVLQRTARAQALPLDKMTLETIVTNFKEPAEVPGPPAAGAYIHGLFLEGASWEADENSGYLAEQRPKELHPRLPVIHVVALESAKKDRQGKYVCPVYYTTQRGPTYIFSADLRLESSSEADDSKWILTGTAAILSEDT